jgi:serine/threonine protein kinase
MSSQGVAVEPNIRETTPLPGTAADAPQGAGAAGPRAGRFTYACGATPLAGYTIKRGVGCGGFGEIYYAVSDAGKEVALKLVRRNLDVELRGMRQCLNLKHPHLLSLYDIRQDDAGDTWIVMEYVAGRSLEDQLAENPNGLAPQQALHWIHGIGAGVRYLHDHGIVHRDLKPGNVFCDEGVVKVGDYGLSKFLSSSRRSGQTESIGTVHYMAPEVANGRYGKEIDVYALGIILYELLTGRVPFDGESVGEVLMKHLTARPDVSMLAEPYRSVVARALEKDPQRRYHTVVEMLSALPPWGASPFSKRDDAQPRAENGTVPLGAGAPDASIPLVTPEVVHEEPIWRAVRRGSAACGRVWRSPDFDTPAKVIVSVIIAVIFLSNAPGLVQLAIFLGVLYGAYRLIRAIVLSASTPARPVVMPPRRVARPEKPSQALVLKPLRQRLAELVGALLVSAVVALTVCVVVVLLRSWQNNPPGVEHCAWLALMSIAGSWAVLLPAKVWEGTRGEPILRRFLMMILGLGLGVLAFALAEHFLVRWPVEAAMPRAVRHLPANFYGEDGRPLAMAYLAVFGTLYLVMRWWRQADPLRRTRLSLWAVFVTLAVAAFVSGIWQFPAPWFMLTALTISISVQLASPWVPLHQRTRPRT